MGGSSWSDAHFRMSESGAWHEDNYGRRQGVPATCPDGCLHPEHVGRSWAPGAMPAEPKVLAGTINWKEAKLAPAKGSLRILPPMQPAGRFEGPPWFRHWVEQGGMVPSECSCPGCQHDREREPEPEALDRFAMIEWEV